LEQFACATGIDVSHKCSHTTSGSGGTSCRTFNTLLQQIEPSIAQQTENFCRNVPLYDQSCEHGKLNRSPPNHQHDCPAKEHTWRSCVELVSLSFRSFALSSLSFVRSLSLSPTCTTSLFRNKDTASFADSVPYTNVGNARPHLCFGGQFSFARRKHPIDRA
jgi:hypothetical protein